MVLRVIIISTLLLLNFTHSPSFWLITVYNLLGFLILILTMLPLIGHIVVIGCGYLTFNYLYNIHDINIYTIHNFRLNSFRVDGWPPFRYPRLCS